jgi:hypothetical protein
MNRSATSRRSEYNILVVRLPRRGIAGRKAENVWVLKAEEFRACGYDSVDIT